MVRSLKTLERFLMPGRYLVAILIAVAVSWTLALARDFTAVGLPRPMAELSFAALLTVCGLLLMPEPGAHPLARAVAPWFWALLAAGACTVVGISGSADALTGLAVSWTVFCTVVLFASAVMIIPGRDPAWGPERLSIVLIAALMMLSPLWLAPLAEAAAPDRTVANLAIALSPLTYLSAAADYDYLRTPWFYGHSAIGSLRYDYPPPVVYAAVCLGAGLAATLTSLRPNRGRPEAGRHGSNPQGEEA